MRIALISDIHGHHIALDAVLADLAHEDVDKIICLGDVATIGPQPKQVIRRLIELGCPCITGNHDAALLDPEKAVQYDISAPLLPSLWWCSEQLESVDREFLAATLPIFEINLTAEKSLLCFHGSPKAYQDIIHSYTPVGQVTRFLRGTNADIYVGGHTHLQMLRNHDGCIIFNPGSVGAPFRSIPERGTEPSLFTHTEYGIIDSDDQRIQFEFRQISFDRAAYIKVLKGSDLPVREWWLKQYGA